MEDSVTWTIRSSAWELLAISLRYPTPELAEAITSGEWIAAAQEIAAALGAVLPRDFSVESDGCADELYRSLRQESTRLFIGAPTSTIPFYEGIWRSDGEGGELMFVNRYAMEVERYCKACGLMRPDGTNEPLDCASTECELMELLALAVSGEVWDTMKPDAFPGGSPQAAYESFKLVHVSQWLPYFAESVAAEAQEPFYRAVGQWACAVLPAL